MLDFVVIFLEGLAFFVLSLLINHSQPFFTLLAGLFLMDAGWVWLTRLTSQSPTEEGAGYAIWSIVNISAALLLLLSTWSNLLNWSFWKTEMAETIAVGIIAVIRTVVDYATVWSFYYPPPPESPYIMPVPRPAIPPPKATSDTTGIVTMNQDKVKEVADVIHSVHVPRERESAPHSFKWTRSKPELANCYLAIVAICHQTSPHGEQRLTGKISGEVRQGWDYLKERFLTQALTRPELADPAKWSEITPKELSELFRDPEYGHTLSGVAERARLLNDLGRKLTQAGVEQISEAFEKHGSTVGGESGFVRYLRQFESYSDPLGKKTMFFISLAMNECDWAVSDPENLRSPIDYHELRGHLRIGTIAITDRQLARKLDKGLPVDPDEDIALRSAAQAANSSVAVRTGVTESALHYLLWNVFRSCCPRDSAETHCNACGDGCMLPDDYREMSGYQGRCIFSGVCNSASNPVKLVDPPYSGHYY